MKKHLAIVLPLLVLGCGEPKDTGQDGGVVTPAAPRGTVSGQVLNTRMEPLAGASVRLTLGSATAEQPLETETDASGNFMLEDVPAGSQVLVTLAKEGYATLRASTVVPSSTGNAPLHTGNASLGVITLAQLNGTVRFTLVTPSGRPAAGAQAYLEAVPAGTLAFQGTTATAVSTVMVPAVADGQGVVTFQGVPAPLELARIGGYGDEAGGYRLWVDPVDLPTADGILDSGGYARKMDAATLVVYGGSQLIPLPAPRGDAGTVDPNNPGTAAGFRVLTTNVPSLTYVKLADADPLKAQTELLRKPVRNMLRLGDPIYIGFSHPVVKDSLLALLTDEFGRESLGLGVTPSPMGDFYTLTHTGGALREGREYNLILRATSAQDGSTRAWKGFFITGGPDNPMPLQLASFAYKDMNGNDRLDGAECVVITFNQPVLSPLGGAKPEAFFNADISSDNVGEYGSPKGLQLGAAPPPTSICFGESTSSMTFPIDVTNFNDATQRFFFVYPSANLQLNTGTPLKVKVDFASSRSVDVMSYYETASGTPILPTMVLETTLTRLP